MNKYRVMLILAASLREEILDGVLDRIREEITKLKGEVATTNVIGKKTFARTMGKKDNGLYVKMTMNMDPANIDALLNRFKLNEDVFRVQITRGDDEKQEESSTPIEVVESVEQGESNGKL